VLQGTTQHKMARERYDTTRVPIHAGTTCVTCLVLKHGVTGFLFIFDTARHAQLRGPNTARHDTKHDTTQARLDTTRVSTNMHDTTWVGTTRQGNG
jgi:hypothetical protein